MTGTQEGSIRCDGDRAMRVRFKTAHDALYECTRDQLLAALCMGIDGSWVAEIHVICRHCSCWCHILKDDFRVIKRFMRGWKIKFVVCRDCAGPVGKCCWIPSRASRATFLLSASDCVMLWQMGIRADSISVAGNDSSMGDPFALAGHR